MTPADPDRIREDLQPNLAPSEADGMVEVGLRLSAARPLPDPNFRGELRRQLAGAQASGAVAPRRIRALAASYALTGLLLLAVAGIGVAGSGPFAA